MTSSGRMLTCPTAIVPDGRRRRSFRAAIDILSSFQEVDETPECTVDQLSGREFESVRCAKDGQSFRWFCFPTNYVPGDLAYEDNVRHDPDFDPRYPSKGFKRYPRHVPVEKLLSEASFEELFGRAVTEFLRTRAETHGTYSLSSNRASLLGLTEALRLQEEDIEEVEL